MDIQEFKNEVKGNFFRACFVKKDGTIREMTARFGVKKYLKGGELSYNPESHNYIVVFDIEKKEYRTINLDKLVYLRYNKKEVIGNQALLHYLSWGGFMKLRLDEIAQEMINAGFNSSDFDKDSFTNRVIEILDSKDLFALIADEMTLIEDENHPEPRNIDEYLERIGEF